MKILNRRNKLFLAGLATICVASTPSIACKCIKASSAKAGLKAANTVFVGKAMDFGYQKLTSRVQVKMAGGKVKMVESVQSFHKIRFIASRSWKGAPQRTVVVLTPFSGSPACGYSFVRGREYLVYANIYRWPKQSKITHLYTSTCQRTTDTLKAKKDLAELGMGTRVELSKITY
jgi:hypothetical protein